MRVAALELEDLGLQLVRRDRGWTSEAVAGLVTGAVGREVLTAVTGAARVRGAAPGQTASAAKARVPGLELVRADFDREAKTLAALAEALLAVTPAVEISPAGALLLDASAAALVSVEALPPGMSPAISSGEDRAEQNGRRPPREGANAHARQELAWADAALAIVEDFGLRGRIAVADTPEAARLVAATQEEQAVSVQQGRMASAVQEVPLAVVQHLMQEAALHRPAGARPATPAPVVPALKPESFALFESLGMKRLGGVRALPPSTLVERLGEDAERILRLAAGGRPRPLVGHAPAPALREDIDFEPAVEEAAALVFALRPLVERLFARLCGRGLAASKLVLTLSLESRERGRSVRPKATGVSPDDAKVPRPKASLPPIPRPREDLVFALARPTTEPRLVVELLRERLSHWQAAAPTVSVSLAVTETAARRDQFGLGERPRVTEALESVLSRLKSRLGEDQVGSPRALPEHLPELSTGWAPFRPPAPVLPPVPEETPARETPAADESLFALGRPLREKAPEPLEVERDQAGVVRALVRRGLRQRVVEASAPERLATGWWAGGLVRDYQTLLLADGSRVRAFQDPRGRWWWQGVYD